MTARDDAPEPGMTDAEWSVLVTTWRLLEHQKPVPSAAFRGNLRRRLISPQDPAIERLGRRWTTRGGFACLATGVALLAIAAIGLAGVGPLAPEDVGTALAMLI